MTSSSCTKAALAIVADGMGGMKAARRAVIWVETVSSFYRDRNGSDPQQVVERSIEAAHERVREWFCASETARHGNQL